MKRRGLRIHLGIAVALVGCGVLAATIPLAAATATANLSVTATVANNCTISTSALAFGAYDPIVTNAATPKEGTGSVTITCTKDSAPTIGLDVGSNADGSQRRLASGTARLNYQIYREASYTNVWGTGADVYDPGAAPSFAPRTITAYGRIAAGQDVPAGSYTDTVVATVTF